MGHAFWKERIEDKYNVHLYIVTFEAHLTYGQGSVLFIRQ